MNGSTHQRLSIGALSRAIPRLSFVAFGVLTVMAAIYTPVAATNDWTLFHDTASLLLAGRRGEIYPGITPGYPFLYPPPFLWHVAWLGLLTPGAAHVALIGAMAVALGAALWMLHRGLDDRARTLDSWIFVVLSSAGCVWTLTAGHIAAWFVLLLTIALLQWRNGKELAAGFVLSLIAIKPHYCIPILLCVLLGRAWRVLGGAVVGLAFLALTTVPLGHEVWARYLEQLATVGGTVAEIPPWKQITLLAFWRSVLGDARPLVVAAATLSSVVPCVLLVLLAWIKCRTVPATIPRLLGATVLMLLTCNVYSFHYDALLLTIPGAVWYLRGHEYASARSHLAIGVAISLAYVAQHLSAMVLQSGLALTGPILAAWLVFDARDLLRARAHLARPASSDPEIAPAPLPLP